MAFQAPTIYLASALTVACVAAIFDLRSRRIPNLLTGPAILFGLALHLVLGGPAELGWSLLAGGIAGGVFLLFFLAGGMGAGDVKLMTAIGCLCGTLFIKDVLLTTVVVGAVMGIGLALYRRRLRSTVANVIALVSHHSAHGLVAHESINVKNTSSLRLPYALPIAAGCLLTFASVFGKQIAQ